AAPAITRIRNALHSELHLHRNRAAALVIRYRSRYVGDATARRRAARRRTRLRAFTVTTGGPSHASTPARVEVRFLRRVAGLPNRPVLAVDFDRDHVGARRR